MSYDEAVQKVAKLLRLAQSNNANEAALAAARAQEIIDKYRIETAALDLEADGTSHKPDEPIKDFRDDLLDAEGKQFATWKWRMFIKLAEVNGCKGYVTRNSNGKGIAIVGRPSNVATVRYLYAWLRTEAERLAKRDCLGHGRTWANSYRNGVVDTISERLYAAHKESIARVVRELTAPNIFDDEGRATEQVHQPLALVRVQAAVAKVEAQAEQVQEWMDKNLNLRKGGSSRWRADSGARAAGRIAGREIRMSKPKAHLE